MRTLTLLFIAVFFMISIAFSAPLPDTDSIPGSLDPWKAWVLHGEEERFCPAFYNDGEASQCVWPSDLGLELDENGGKFTQKWLVFVKGWVSLPGGKEQWPGQVKVDGKSAVVVAKGGIPSIHMEQGEHLVEGVFVWNEMPEMIRIPPASGLVDLSINGEKAAFSLLDGKGRLWLQKQDLSQDEEEHVEVRVCRLVNDTIPMQISSSVKINISGRAREIKLGGIFPDDYIPLSIKSGIPARLGIEGDLIIQARPGRWEIRVLARSEGPVSVIKALEMPHGEEIWAFQSQNYLRMVKVEGVSSIDPTRTDIPPEWKKFPTFIVRAGDQMVFNEIRRGDPDPAPDQLHLNRTWWLDFDGGGFTIQDRINGTMSRNWRLSMNPPCILGRVSVDSIDQLITSRGNDEKPGVELRRGRLNLVAESRFENSTNNLFAVGWDHDFQSVSGILNLPPGWRLFTASGVDVMPGTWFSRWTLLDLFIVLIISLSVGKLWNRRWGLLALVTVGLIYHEPGAPRILWLHLLATMALLRILPAGWMRKVVILWCLGSFITLLALAVPFMVHQARWGIYPQLEPHVSRAWQLEESKYDDVQTFQQSVAPMPMEQRKGTRRSKIKSFVDSKVSKDIIAYSQQQQLMGQDPDALIQTGPGLPNWSWRSYKMQWNGPVERSQQVRLWLLSPAVNLVLAFVRVVLLALLIFILLDIRKWKMPEGTFTFATVLVCMLLIPGVAFGEQKSSSYPSNEILMELKDRLLEKPDCLPNCAESPEMVLTINPDNLHILFEVHAALETAVPLPGSLELWRPEQVFLDSRPARGLLRNKDGLLWLLVPEGIHSVTLVSNAPVGNTLQIPLPLQPQRVRVKSNGWDVQGVGEDGRVEGGIKITRQQTEDKEYSVIPARTLPPFLHVERVLFLGLNWQVWTTVRRVTPSGTPVVVSVPLIVGESVTSAGVNVEDGNVHVNMGPKVREIRWNSILKTESVIKLKAPDAVSWTESWILDASSIWHCEYKGIPVVHHQDQSGQWRPEWKPWPGEEISIFVSRPVGIPGQSVTIDSVKMTLTPGRRFDKSDLSLTLRSSQGGQHRIVLPEGAGLQLVKISGKTLPIRAQGRDIIVPLRPGSQTVDVAWHQSTAAPIFLRAPSVRIGEQAVNAEVIFQMPRDRWILLAGGPRLGPAVLFWSFMFVIILVALALGQVAWTPLKTHHWLLLGMGLTQVHPLVSIMIVGWLIALGLRKRYSFPGGWFPFNASQIILACWTLAALIGFYVAIHEGLLGIPNMNISGNGSYDYMLHWTQDRIGSGMPEPWVISLPLIMFRILMLLWALWLAYSLLKWLRWGWQCFCEGGLWRKMRKPGQKKNAPPPLPGRKTGGQGVLKT